MNKRTPDMDRRGFRDDRRKTKRPTPKHNNKTKKTNFWNGWAGTQFMAPKAARRRRGRTSLQRSLFKPNGKEPVVRLIPEREFHETLGMSIDEARSAGLIERSAEINGERFYRLAPEVRP